MEKENQEGCSSSHKRSRVSEEDAEFPRCLKLTKTPSYLALIESRLKEAREKGNEDLIVQQITENPQDSIIPADELQIGSWQRKSIRKGDLLAKIDYATMKLVWEVLEGALRNKIEIQWSYVSAIRAHMVNGDRGMLEIELKSPPRFFLEDPQPRRASSKWQEREDFTGGEASNCRLHSVFFPPGELDIHYEKLLQYDQRPFDLSKKLFPSQPTLPQEFPHDQITCSDFNITNQNPLTYEEVVYLSDLLDLEQAKANIICDHQQPVQSSPTFQIPDNGMNTSSNPHGQRARGQGQSNLPSSSNRYPNQGNHPDMSSH